MNFNNTPPNYVLVEMYSDGYIRAYGDKSIRCHIFNRPHCISIESAKLAEELVENALPRPFREIYFPGMVRKTGNLRKITPIDIQTAVWNIELLNSVGGNQRYRKPTDAIRDFLGG